MSRTRAATTAREAVHSARTAIAAAGCETPQLDAELIVAHALGVNRERLLTDPGLIVAPEQVRPLQEMVRRRAIEREPVAYIVGMRAFRRLRLAVDPRALIPRPETELLVEVGVELLPSEAHVLDVGTGSGAVALALADERPDLAVSGSDASAAALALAAENGRRLGLDVHWLQADTLEGIPDEFDAVLANLPYVADRERRSLAPEIARHEPAGALFAGADGLDAIRALTAQMAHRQRLRLVALEVGAGQSERVRELLRESGFTDIQVRRDLAGIDRVVAGTRAR